MFNKYSSEAGCWLSGDLEEERYNVSIAFQNWISDRRQFDWLTNEEDSKVAFAT